MELFDLGASQTVMGEYQLGEFLKDLPQDVRAKVREQKVREQKVSMTFRFGNTTAQFAIVRFWSQCNVIGSG